MTACSQRLAAKGATLWSLRTSPLKRLLFLSSGFQRGGSVTLHQMPIFMQICIEMGKNEGIFALM